jgi:hypothetical protein
MALRALARRLASRRHVLSLVSFVSLGLLPGLGALASVGCGRGKPQPDPARVAAESSAKPGTAIPNADGPTTAPTAPVLERVIDQPFVAPVRAKTELSIVGLRQLGEFNPFVAQKDGAFEVWGFEPAVPAAKGEPSKAVLVAIQAGFVFTQKEPGGGGKQVAPLSLDTKTVTGSPLAAAYSLRRLEGRWPDALFAEATFQGPVVARQQSASSGVYERAEGKWAKKESIPAQVVAYGADGLLARGDGTLTTLRGTLPHAVTPTPAPTGQPCTTAAEQPVYALSFDARVGSGVVSAGRRCKVGPLAVERFSPEKADGKGVIVPLPGIAVSDAARFSQAQVSVGSGGAFVVLFRGLVRDHYLAAALPGGGGVQELRLPTGDGLDGHPTSVQMTADGAIFVFVHRPEAGGLQHPLVLRLFEGAWTAFEPPPLPGSDDRLGAHRLFAFDHETFVFGTEVKLKEGPGYAALVGSTDPKKPLIGTSTQIQTFLDARVAEVAAPAKTPSAVAAPPGTSAAPATFSAPPPPEPPPFTPYAEGCATPFVDIFEVSKNAAATFTFPSTQKALASFPSLSSIHLVEFLHRGKRRLGARVPDAEVGQALVAHIQQTMKDEKPSLVCFVPNEAVGFREVPIGGGAPAKK